MNSIMQGTTPSLKIIIDTNDFLISDVTAIELYIKNKDDTTTYTMEDLVIDAEENSITKVFTADETGNFNPKYRLVVQGRFWFSDGSIVGINKISLDVADMLEVGD